MLSSAGRSINCTSVPQTVLESLFMYYDSTPG